MVSREFTEAARPRTETDPQRILIVKLGAFGNVILSLGAFRAIREFHARARISVLTSAPYAEWLRTFPYFDEVLIDPHPSWWDLPAARRLGRMLADGGFDRVYDLQTSKRSSWYFALLPIKHRPEWSGIAFGCSLPDRDRRRNTLHDAVRQQGQLRQAGIDRFPPADVSWMTGDIRRFGLPEDFALLVPGSSPDRLTKRWPAAQYRRLTERLAERGIASVVLGAGAEADLAAAIPGGIDLIGRTGFGDLASLARAAKFAVGNDTGPMHLIATAGCPSVTLFSRDSNPSLCAPVGPETRVLQRPDLADLPVEAVLECLPEAVAA